jgi:hypothetical protein
LPTDTPASLASPEVLPSATEPPADTPVPPPTAPPPATDAPAETPAPASTPAAGTGTGLELAWAPLALLALGGAASRIRRRMESRDRR